MADPFNLVTQYERQLERGREPLQRFDSSLQRGLDIGLQSRTRKLQEELLEGKVEEQKRQLSINDQLMQNPRKLIDEFGALTTTDERLKFLAKNAGIAASPMGAKVLEQLSGLTDSMIRQEAQSGVMQAKNARTKMLLELAVPAGVDPTDQEAMNVLLNNKATADLQKRFLDNKKVLRADMITPDLFPYPGVVDEMKALALMERADDTTIEPLSNFGKMTAERNALLAMGDTEGVARYDAEMAPKGFTFETTPDGRSILTQGPISGSGVERTTKAQIEQRLGAMEELNLGVSELLAEGAQRHFGVIGALGNKIQDEMLANIPGIQANEARVKARAKNARLRQLAARSLGEEKGALSEGDVRRMALLFPPDGILSISPSKAESLWEEIQVASRDRAKRLGEQIGQPAIWAYSVNELRNLPDVFPNITARDIAAELLRREKRRGLPAPRPAARVPWSPDPAPMMVP